MSHPFPPSTKTELATQTLRSRIRLGELEPGEPLRIDVLTRELGMSSTPVREALRLLQADGLVDYHPHRGTTVAASKDDQSVDEVYRLRMILEPYATKAAVGLMTDEELAKLEQTHQSLVRVATAQRLSRRRLSEHNVAWHWMIYRASRMPILAELIERLWDAFPWRTVWVLPETITWSVEDHEAIMAAVRQRDGNAAAEGMRAHIGRGHTMLAHEGESGAHADSAGAAELPIPSGRRMGQRPADEPLQ